MTSCIAELFTKWCPFFMKKSHILDGQGQPKDILGGQRWPNLLEWSSSVTKYYWAAKGRSKVDFS